MYGEEAYSEHSCSLQQATQDVCLPRPTSCVVQDARVQADQGDCQEGVVLPQVPQFAALS